MAQEYALNDPSLYAIFESQYGLPEGILYAQAKQESAFNPKARSPVGAQGLMQFMPATAKQYGVDVKDPVQSIEGAARMMSDLLNKYNGDTQKALAGYNWGQGNVDKKGVERLPMETSKYIASIEKTLADLRAKKQSSTVQDNAVNPSTQGGGSLNSNALPFNSEPSTLQEQGSTLEGQPPTDEEQILLQIRDSLPPQGLEKLKAKLQSMSPQEKQSYKRGMIELFKQNKLPFQTQQPEQSTQPQQQEPSFLDQAGRGVGLAARSLSSGVAGLPLMVGDALNAGINLGTSGINAALGTEIPQLGRASESFSQLQDMAGLPTPQNATERVAGTVGEFLGGAATGIGGGSLAARSANPVTRGVGETLAAQPIMQGASAVTGGLAAGGAAEMGLPPIVQGAAGLIGGSLPYAFPIASSIPTAGGVSPQQVQKNLADFETAGVSPSLGQLTEAFPARGIESGLSITPGSAGVMYKRGEALAEGLKAKVDELADSLSTVGTKEGTGISIKEGIQNYFLPKAQTKQRTLYANYEKFVPKDMYVPTTETPKILDEIVSSKEGYEELFKVFENDKMLNLKNYFDKLGQDSVAPFLPYDILKQFRTQIGRKLEGFELISDAPRADLKRLYKSLTADLESVAKTQGKEAYKAFKDANNFTRQLHENVDNILTPIIRSEKPEQIFKDALSGSKDGASRLRVLMNSLPIKSKKALSSNVLREMGRAVNSRQDEVGSVFSPETFLTNWNKLHPQAKEVLFNNYGDTFKHDLNAIARVTSNLRKGANVYRNPSGTAGATANAAGIGVILSFLASGNVIGAAKTAGVFGGANILARAMTNPTAVRWIVMQSKKPKFSPASAINNLREMAKRKDDAEASSIADELQNPSKTLDLGTIYNEEQ